MTRARFIAPLIAILSAVFWYTGAQAAFSPVYSLTQLTDPWNVDYSQTFTKSTEYANTGALGCKFTNWDDSCTYTSFTAGTTAAIDTIQLGLIGDLSNRLNVYLATTTPAEMNTGTGYDFMRAHSVAYVEKQFNRTGIATSTEEILLNKRVTLHAGTTYYLYFYGFFDDNEINPTSTVAIHTLGYHYGGATSTLLYDSTANVYNNTYDVPVKLGTAYGTSSLQWSYPINGATVPNTGFDWYFETYNASTSLSRIVVDYGDCPDAAGPYHAYLNNHPSSSLSADVPAAGILGNGTWCARAKMVEQTTGHQIANAGIISFTVVSPTSTLYTTSSVPCDRPSSTLDVAGWVVFGVCGLFSPSQSSQIALSNLGTELRGKAPWGYIEAATNAINGMTTSTGASSSIAGIGAAFSSFLTPLRDILGLLLWAVFGIWIVKRFQHVHT